MSTAEPLAVYDGRHLLGTVAETAEGFVARDADDLVVGVFTDRRSAIRALSDRARQAGDRQ